MTPEPLKTRDRDMRAVILDKVLAAHVSDPDVRVIEELGIEHGTCRVDIAVVNGFIHGFELKSESDTLLRLPRQIEAYSRSLDRATLVVSQAHLKGAEALLPRWWGIKVVARTSRGSLKVSTHRGVANNPGLSLFHMAHLMWRSEVVACLKQRGASAKELGANRAALYQLFVDTAPSVEVRRQVREALKRRENWRRPSPLL
jgi:hypothetical protein